MGDGRVVILITGTESFEIGIEPLYTLRHFVYGLKADRHPIIRERELRFRKHRLPAEVQSPLSHPVQAS